LYLSQVESRHVVRVIANPGERVQLHCSAIGKVLLAYMPEDDLAKALRQVTMAPMTVKTIQSVDQLRRELDVIRACGYSTDDEEHTLDVRCVAGAIFSEHGLPIAALSLSGPKTRVTAERMRTLGMLVGQAAGKLTADYGGQIPSMPFFGPRIAQPGTVAVG
jgi:IclR family acetate operon transcriptional repressor